MHSEHGRVLKWAEKCASIETPPDADFWACFVCEETIYFVSLPSLVDGRLETSAADSAWGRATLSVHGLWEHCTRPVVKGLTSRKNLRRAVKPKRSLQQAASVFGLPLPKLDVTRSDREDPGTPQSSTSTPRSSMPGKRSSLVTETPQRARRAAAAKLIASSEGRRESESAGMRTRGAKLKRTFLDLESDDEGYEDEEATPRGKRGRAPAKQRKNRRRSTEDTYMEEEDEDEDDITIEDHGDDEEFDDERETPTRGGTPKAGRKVADFLPKTGLGNFQTESPTSAYVNICIGKRIAEGVWPCIACTRQGDLVYTQYDAIEAKRAAPMKVSLKGKYNLTESLLDFMGRGRHIHEVTRSGEVTETYAAADNSLQWRQQHARVCFVDVPEGEKSRSPSRSSSQNLAIKVHCVTSELNRLTLWRLHEESAEALCTWEIKEDPNLPVWVRSITCLYTVEATIYVGLSSGELVVFEVDSHAHLRYVRWTLLMSPTPVITLTKAATDPDMHKVATDPETHEATTDPDTPTDKLLVLQQDATMSMLSLNTSEAYGTVTGTISGVQPFLRTFLDGVENQWYATICDSRGCFYSSLLGTGSPEKGSPKQGSPRPGSLRQGSPRLGSVSSKISGTGQQTRLWMKGRRSTFATTSSVPSWLDQETSGDLENLQEVTLPASQRAVQMTKVRCVGAGSAGYTLILAAHVWGFLGDVTIGLFPQSPLVTFCAHAMSSGHFEWDKFSMLRYGLKGSRGSRANSLPEPKMQMVSVIKLGLKTEEGNLDENLDLSILLTSNFFDSEGRELEIVLTKNHDALKDETCDRRKLPADHWARDEMTWRLKACMLWLLKRAHSLTPRKRRPAITLLVRLLKLNIMMREFYQAKQFLQKGKKRQEANIQHLLRPLRLAFILRGATTDPDLIYSVEKGTRLITEIESFKTSQILCEIVTACWNLLPGQDGNVPQQFDGQSVVKRGDDRVVNLPQDRKAMILHLMYLPYSQDVSYCLGCGCYSLPIDNDRCMLCSLPLYI